VTTRRWILILLGLAALAVIAAAAARWEDIAVRIAVHRLAADRNLDDVWLWAEPASIEGRAVRAHFRERPGALARRILHRIIETDEDLFPLVEEAHLAGVDGGTIEISRRPDLEPLSWQVEFRRADGSGGWRSSGHMEKPLDRLIRLVEDIEGLTAPFGGATGLSCTAYHEDIDGEVRAGFRLFLGETEREEATIEMGPSLATWKEVLVLGRPNGAALDPATGRWRPIRGGPRGSGARAVEMGDGRVIAASKTAPLEVAFDLHGIADGSWTPIATAGKEAFPGTGRDGVGERVALEAGVSIGPEALFVLAGRNGSGPLRGIGVDASGRMRPIATEGAPRGLNWGFAVHAFGRKVFVWGNLSVGCCP